MEHTARYDPNTGEIMGIFPEIVQGENTIVVPPEVVDDPHQYRFNGQEIVKKTQAEIDKILRTREEGKIKAERKARLVEDMEFMKAELTEIKARLSNAGL